MFSPSVVKKPYGSLIAAYCCGSRQKRYQPPDPLLEFLENL